MKSDRQPVASRLITGVLIIAVGLIFWFDQLGRIDAGDFLEWWPVALIAIGVGFLSQRQWLAATINIFVGSAFLAEKLWRGFDVAYVFGLWPLTITIGGAALVAQALRPAAKDLGAGTAFHAVAFMAGNVRSVTSRNFAGGDAVAVMGGCEVDLRNATIAAGEAVLDVVSFWGGIEVRVPPNWTVVNKVIPILASNDDRTSPAQEGNPRLVIRGALIMAGLEVTNNARTAA